MELLGEAGRHDAHDTGVPSLAGHHDARGGEAAPVEGDGAAGDVEDLLLDDAAGGVLGVEHLGELPGAVRVLGDQQLQGAARVPEPPRGVDARGEAEGDVLDGGLAIRDAGHLHEGADARRGVPAEEGEAVDDGHAVLVHEGDHVGHRGHGDEGEGFGEPLPQRRRHAGPAAEPPGDGPGELEGDPRPAEPGERVGGPVGPQRAGVHDGHGGRGRAVPGEVVVRYDDVQPELPGEGDLRHGLRSVVHGADDLHPVGGEAADGVGVEPVPLGPAVREIGDGVPPRGAEEGEEEGGAADAVHVVVPVDGDPLPPAEGRGDAGGPGLHPGQEVGFVHVGDVGAEEAAGRPGVGDPPPREEEGREGGELQLRGQEGGGLPRGLGEEPAGVGAAFGGGGPAHRVNLRPRCDRRWRGAGIARGGPARAL